MSIIVILGEAPPWNLSKDATVAWLLTGASSVTRCH